MSLGILVLAAGASRRFGTDDKLLAQIDGQPMLWHVLQAVTMIEADFRLVVARSEPVARLARSAKLPVEMTAPGLSQSDSLKAGLSRLRDTGVSRLMITLGDMPWITGDDLRDLVTLAGDLAACATDGVTPMPPALFPESMFHDLGTLEGDRGAGRLLRDIPPDRRLLLPAQHLRDIDLRSDLP